MDQQILHGIPNSDKFTRNLINSHIINLRNHHAHVSWELSETYKVSFFHYHNFKVGIMLKN